MAQIVKELRRCALDELNITQWNIFVNYKMELFFLLACFCDLDYKLDAIKNPPKRVFFTYLIGG